MRLKTGKKIRTTSVNSKFASSCTKRVHYKYFFLIDYLHCYWLGLKRFEDNRIFKWSDSSSFYEFDEEIVLETNYSTRYEDCICVFIKRDVIYARLLRCSSTSKVLCQKKGTEVTLRLVNVVLKDLYSYNMFTELNCSI